MFKRTAALWLLFGLYLIPCSHASKLDLQEVSDRMEIEDTLTTHYMKADEKNWPAVQSVVGHKVKFDMSSLTGDAPSVLTPQEITAIWEKGLKEIKAIHRQAGNFQFKISGDGAEVHCYGIAFHY